MDQFEWYIFLLQDGLTDELRVEIDANFERLGQLAGPDVVVVRGYDQQGFHREVQEAYAGIHLGPRDVRPPALFVTDIPRPVSTIRRLEDVVWCSRCGN